jgi:hypothetical protein
MRDPKSLCEQGRLGSEVAVRAGRGWEAVEVGRGADLLGVAPRNSVTSVPRGEWSGS